MEKLLQLQQLIRNFQKAYEGGYVHVEFCDADFTWGYIYFRKGCSGGVDGEIMFHDQTEAVQAVENLLTASQRVGLGL